tara:strand:- start:42 stop:1139 length:1098 start_codon:yes stop_codon:yes gene_type:complete
MAYTTIDDPSKYFQVEIYTDGDATTNDTTSQTFDGNSDLQPDWMWFKSRNVVGNHGHMDTSRGKEGGTSFRTLFLTTADERTSSSGYDLTAMNSDGFSYGRPNQLDWAHDTPAQNTVWAWACNGGTRTTFNESGANPGGGRQTNTTAGFSIIDYTGTGSNGTIAHGLPATPSLVIVKNRDGGNSDSWFTHWTGLLNDNQILYWMNTDGATANASAFNSTAPDSTNITVGTNSGTNKDGDKYIMYTFTDIQGYSKSGIYNSNNAAVGPFIHTGFRPAFIMLKMTDGGSSWRLYDHKRVGYNRDNRFLSNNSTAVENTAASELDICSNGFKLVQAEGDINYNDSNVVYMAWAEHPFVSSTGVPTPAR